MDDTWWIICTRLIVIVIVVFGVGVVVRIYKLF
jgi:hypothetical protein